MYWQTRYRNRKGQRGNQEICLIDFAELHRFYPLSLHQQDTDHDHSKHQYNCQSCKVFWHKKSQHPIFKTTCFGK